MGQKELALVDAKGTAGAAAATAGVEGHSVDALLRSFDTATGGDIALTYLQRDNEIAQSRAEQKGIEMDTTNRLTSVKQQVPEDPSMKMLGRLFNAAFQVGGSYIQNTTKNRGRLWPLRVPVQLAMAERTPADFRKMMTDALSPIVDRRRLIAAKVFYVYTCDDHTLDVGTLSIAFNERTRDVLAALIREEQELASWPHAEHNFSFGKPPTRH